LANVEVKAPTKVDKKEEPVPKSTGGNNVPKVEESRNSGSSQHLRRRSSTLVGNVVGVSGAEPYETLLVFILRQSEELREHLLDVYSNPKLNPILVNSYLELKHMEKEEQERVWNALLTRWKRFG